MAGQARVRGRYLKDFLTAVDGLPASPRAEIMDRISNGTLRAIKESAPLGWLPLAANVELTHAVQEVLDERQAHHFFRNLLNAVYGTSLFYQFVQGAIRMFGNSESPSGAARMIPRGFGLIFDNAGRWSVSCPGPLSAEIRASALPGLCDRRWLLSVADSLHSLFDQVALSGHVTLEQSEDEPDRALFRMEWINRTIPPPPAV